MPRRERRDFRTTSGLLKIEEFGISAVRPSSRRTVV